MESTSSRLIQGTKYSLLSLIIVTLIISIQSIIVARILGPENLGIFTILTNMQGIVALLAVFGIPAATVKFVAEFNVKDKKILDNTISTSMFLISFLAIFISVIYFSSANLIALNLYHEPVLIPLIKISSITVLISSSSLILKSILQGFQKIELLSKLNILNSIISLIMVSYLVFNYGLIGAVIGVFIYTVISTSINLRYTYLIFKEKKVNFQFNINKKVTKKILNYGFPALLSSIVVIPAFWFANTILALKSGFGQVGLFGVAQNLANLLMFIPSAIAIPLIPIISELYTKNIIEMSSIISRIFRVVGLFLLPFAISIALFSKDIINIVYGQQFCGAWYILFFMAATIFLSAFDSIIGSVMLGTGKMWEAFGVNLFWMCCFIPLSYFFITNYGLNGLGYAYLISYLFFTVLITLYATKKLKIKFENLSSLIAISVASFTISFLILIKLDGGLFYATSIIFLIGLIVVEYLILTKEDRDLIYSNIRGF